MPTPTRQNSNPFRFSDEMINMAAPIPTNTTFNCAICGTKTPAVNKILAVKDGDDIEVSPDCIEKDFIKCADCGEYHHKNDEHFTVGDRKICEYCFNDSYGICEECGLPFHNDDYSGNDGLCRGCWQYHSRDSIQDYSSKAPATFLAKKVIKNKLGKDITTYFGVELEVECGENNKTILGKKVREIMGDFIITKHDGSLDNGFEIVTVPADLEIQLEKWNALDSFPSGISSWTKNTCGLHIHVSRRPLSPLQIGKILVFMNSGNNADFIEKIAGRKMNNYCIRKDKSLIDALPKHATRDRREAVNLTNKETIEFRIFKGTLKKESVYKNLEFCDSLVKFCGVAQNSINKKSNDYIGNVDNYINYVKMNKYQYPHLYAFIKTRWLGESWTSNDGKTDLGKKYGFAKKKTSDIEE